MPLSPEERKLPPAQIAEKLKYFSLAEFSYEKLCEDIDAAHTITDEGERLEAMRQVYVNMVNTIADSNLKYKTLQPLLGNDYLDQFPGDQLSAIGGYGPSIAGTEVLILINSICKERGYNVEYPVFLGMSPEDHRDFLLRITNKYTIEHVRNEFFHSELSSNYQIREEMRDLMRLTGSERGVQWSGDFNEGHNRAIAELYSSYVHVKEVQDGRGFFWRLFHPIETFRMRGIIKTTEKFFRERGFDPENDADTALMFLSSTMISQAAVDTDNINAAYKSVTKDNREKSVMKEVDPITVCRDRLKEVSERELNADPAKVGTSEETSVYKTLRPVYAKYGISMPDRNKAGAPSGMTGGPEGEIATEYDLLRTTKLYDDYIKMTFYRNTMNILKGYFQGGNITVEGITEALKDVAFASTTIYNTFTMLYELEDTVDRSKGAAFGGNDRKSLFNMVKKTFWHNNLESPLTDEQLQEAVDVAMTTYKDVYLNDNPKIKFEKKLSNPENVAKEEGKVENKEEIKEEIKEDIKKNGLYEIQEDIEGESEENEEIENGVEKVEQNGEEAVERISVNEAKEPDSQKIVKIDADTSTVIQEKSLG